MSMCAVRAAVLVAALVPLAASQTTILVPDDMPTIQAAIDAAANGDTVLVSPGTYVENVDFLGKDIRVEATDGPIATTIDGGGASHVVRFIAGESPAAQLSGFTLTNGCACNTPGTPGANGGGVLIVGSSPIIERCIITGNHADLPGTAGGWGGGVAVMHGGVSGAIQPVLRHCTIVNNTTTFQAGGVWVNSTGGDTFVTIENSIIWDNSPGGVMQQPTAVVDVSFTDNQSSGAGVGNISTDPLLAPDYSLAPGSPCIDAGDPAAALDPDGTRADMGAVPFDQPVVWTDLGHALPSAFGTPLLVGTGEAIEATPTLLSLTSARPFATAPLVVSAVQIDAPFKMGVMVPKPDLIKTFTVDGFGDAALAFPWPAGVPAGFVVYVQWWVQDATAPANWAASNGVSVSAP